MLLPPPRDLSISAKERILVNFFPVGSIAKHRVSHVEDQAVAFAEPVLELTHIVSLIAHARGPSNLAPCAFRGDQVSR